jgi:hypothetical protein
MEIIGTVANAIQRLFGEVAQTAANKCKVIRRQRKFSATSLLQTFTMGFLTKADASDEDLAQVAGQLGVGVTTQAIEQRHTPQMATFLQEVFQHSARVAVGSMKLLAPILKRFTKVEIKDGSTITLPASMQEQFAGCGGSHDSGKAAMKLQTGLELRSGAVTIELEQGRSPDAATPRQHERLGPGSLTIKDLGYFDLDVMQEQDDHGEYFLSRLQFGTKVYVDGQDLGGNMDVLRWLAKQPGPFVEREVLLGKIKKLKVRLIAWRAPQEVADRRRRRLRQDLLKKKGREPSDERLAWCDWTIVVTNIPVELLTPEEAVVMYGARWQVELLFKRWKSLNLVAVLSGSTDTRQMIRVWSRLIASLVQHWLILATVWGDPTKSLTKASQAIRKLTSLLISALKSFAAFQAAIETISATLEKTCKRNRRKDAGTFELLNDIGLLNLSLT